MKKLLRALIDLKSYRNLLLFFLSGIFFFVFGIVSFFVVVFSVAFVGSFALALFLYPYADLDIGSYKIDSFGEALIATVIGLVLLALLLHLVNNLFEFIQKNFSIRIGKFSFGRK